MPVLAVFAFIMVIVSYAYLVKADNDNDASIRDGLIGCFGCFFGTLLFFVSIIILS